MGDEPLTPSGGTDEVTDKVTDEVSGANPLSPWLEPSGPLQTLSEIEFWRRQEPVNRMAGPVSGGS